MPHKQQERNSALVVYGYETFLLSYHKGMIRP